MRRKRGASLMYVLIVMGIMSICAVNFVYFVQERNKMMRLREGYKNNG